jgi:hypothetical protein
MSLTFIHPLLGQPRPTFTTLKERADAEARKTLQAARLLAAWRLEDEARARSYYEALYSPPYVEGREDESRNHVPPWHPTPAAITRTDLLRALLATRFEEVIERFFFRRDFARELLESAATRWRTLVESAAAAPPVKPMLLERVWARRWLLLLRRLKSPIDVSVLFGALGDSGYDWLASHDAEYRDGGLTLEEARQRLDERVGSHPRHHMQLPPLLMPAYFDRHGGLAALDAALERSPGVFIVAPHKGLGRSSLFENAWFGRRVYDGLPTSWADRQYTRFRLWCPTIIEPEATAFEARPLEHPTPGWKDELPVHGLYTALPGAKEPWINSAFGNGYNDLRVIVNHAHAHPDRFSFVVLVTEEEYRELATHVPRITAFARVDVPPFEQRDLIPLWFAQLPAVGSGHPEVTSAELLHAFMDAPEEDRTAPTPEAVSYALQRLGVVRGSSAARSMVSAAATGSWPRSPRVRALFEPYVETPERLGDVMRFLEEMP